MFGPDVVVEGDTTMILLGSGDREKPLNTNNPVANYFFMIKDQPTVLSHLSSEATTCGSALICMGSLLPVAAGKMPTTAELNAKKGWYLSLQPNEQVVTSAVTVFGVVFFSTHQPTLPSANSCSANLGVARSYNIAYKNGMNPNGTSDLLFTVLVSGGLPPSPVAGKVTLDSGKTVPFVIGCKGPLEACLPKPRANTANPAKIRSYWYIQK